MKNIYVFGISTGGDVIEYAVDDLIKDSGEIKMNVIANHWSTGEHWCRHDMGISSDWKHNIYKEMYPDGYELIWLGCFDNMEDAYNLVVNEIKINN